MIKKDIIDRVMYDADLTREQATKAVESVIDQFKCGMLHHEDIFLRGFGSFKGFVSNPKKAHDFHSGKAIDIPARRNVRLVLSKEMKYLLNATQHDACTE